MGKEEKCHFSIAAGLKLERRAATKEVVRSGTCRNRNMREMAMATNQYLLLWPPQLLQVHVSVSNSLVTRCFKKKSRTTPSSPRNTPHVKVIAMGTSKDSPLLSGQVTVSWAETSHTRSSVISLLLDLLNSCWVRYAFYKVMIQKYTERSHDLQLLMKITVIFIFCKWDRGGTRMGCICARGVYAQVNLCLGSLSPFALLLCASDFWADCHLTNTALLTSHNWIHMSFP